MEAGRPPSPSDPGVTRSKAVDSWPLGGGGGSLLALLAYVVAASERGPSNQTEFKKK